MREIKFRVWSDGKMDDSPETFTGWLNDNFIFDGYDKGKEPVVMQFTGLLDRHGKEIYEGDVVRTYFDKTEQYEAYTEIGVVNITPLRTEIEDKKHGKYNRFYSHSEVIGNIYENPELLTNPQPHE